MQCMRVQYISERLYSVICHKEVNIVLQQQLEDNVFLIFLIVYFPLNRETSVLINNLVIPQHKQLLFTRLICPYDL